MTEIHRPLGAAEAAATLGFAMGDLMTQASLAALRSEMLGLSALFAFLPATPSEPRLREADDLPLDNLPL